MKIDGSGQTTADRITRAKASGLGVGANEAVQKTGNSTDKQTTQFEALRKKATANSAEAPFDTERVAFFRQQIEQGTFVVNPESVAQGMIFAGDLKPKRQS